MHRRTALGALGILALGATSSRRTFAAAPERGLDTSAEVAARNAALLTGLSEPRLPLRRWQWIVVHHTAAEHATLPGIDRYHRKRFGDPLGAEYHFVINNGKKDGANRPLGLIEIARWQHQAPAWHLFKPANAPDSLALCLVGNFETRPLPPAMLTALTDLTRALMQLCQIPREQVSTHRVVDDKLTQCPGKLFPREAFLRDL